MEGLVRYILQIRVVWMHNCGWPPLFLNGDSGVFGVIGWVCYLSPFLSPLGWLSSSLQSWAVCHAN